MLLAALSDWLFHSVGEATGDECLKVVVRVAVRMRHTADEITLVNLATEHHRGNERC